MIRKLISQIEESRISFTSWVLSFIGILFVRFLLESISSPTRTGVIPSDPYTLVHYSLFFTFLSILTIIIVGRAIKNYQVSANVLLFGLPLLWLAPLIDIVLSGGRGFKMLYIFDTGKKILHNFLTFFGESLEYGATYGMRIGIALSIIGLGYYIYLKTKSTLRSLSFSLLLYVVIFIAGSLPGILYTISNKTLENTSNTGVVVFFEKEIASSNILKNTFHDGIENVPDERLIEIGFNKLMSQVLFLLSVPLLILLSLLLNKQKFLSVIRNARLERVNFYIATLFCGIGFAYINKLGTLSLPVDLLGIFCLIISWTALWMHAVHTNDVVDIDIDKISNTERPLVKNELTHEEMKDVGNVWLFIALLGTWCAGFYPFFMSLVYVSASYIYSHYPLRLRRFPMVPSFLIAVASLATVLSGFFFLSESKDITLFPPLLAVGILVIVTLAINFKDIKDVEGDRANGIFTLPIIFGKNGVKITAVFFALSIFLIPIFLSFYLLYVFILPASIWGYFIILKKPFNEKGVFVLRFILVALIGISYVLAYLSFK